MTDEELSKCLEIEADRDCLKIEIERLKNGNVKLQLRNEGLQTKVDVAAAFLDGLVDIFERDDWPKKAAECRAMAERLRK